MPGPAWTGNLAGFWSVTVRANWRIIFRAEWYSQRQLWHNNAGMASSKCYK